MTVAARKRIFKQYFMPFDKFFQSNAKRKAGPVQTVAAQHRARWPKGQPFERNVALMMKGGGRDWWHFVNVPASIAQTELEAWRENNPGFEFKLA